MPIQHRYTLMCDDVRQEINGKFLLIGVYTPNISVPQLPFLMPTLTFFQTLESDRPGAWGVRLRLQHLETGHNVAEGMGQINFQRPGSGINPIRLQNVMFNAAGTYNFVLEINGQGEPIIVPFDVVLAPPGMPGGPIPNPMIRR